MHITHFTMANQIKLIVVYSILYFKCNNITLKTFVLLLYLKQIFYSFSYFFFKFNNF